VVSTGHRISWCNFHSEMHDSKTHTHSLSALCPAKASQGCQKPFKDRHRHVCGFIIDCVTSSRCDDDKLPIPRLSHDTALVWSYGDAEVPLPRPSVTCLFSSHFPPFCSPSTCPERWRPRLMPSRVWLNPICFFFFWLEVKHGNWPLPDKE
jgi:hypothetical protein